MRDSGLVINNAERAQQYDETIFGIAFAVL